MGPGLGLAACGQSNPFPPSSSPTGRARAWPRSKRDESHRQGETTPSGKRRLSTNPAPLQFSNTVTMATADDHATTLSRRDLVTEISPRLVVLEVSQFPGAASWSPRPHRQVRIGFGDHHPSSRRGVSCQPCQSGRSPRHGHNPHQTLHRCRESAVETCHLQNPA